MGERGEFVMMREKTVQWFVLFAGAMGLSCNAITGAELGKPMDGGGGGLSTTGGASGSGQSEMGGSGGDMESAMVCTPGTTKSCYEGPAGTGGIGICKSGTRICAADGMEWGPCVGQVLPKAEDCDNADSDCDGKLDDICVTAVVSDGENTCALVGGGVKCWGGNFNGALGNAETIASSVPVEPLGLGHDVEKIAIWNHRACAIQKGALKCWGRNKGYDGLSLIGDGSIEDRLVPTDVTGMDAGVTMVATGDSHACAVKDGEMYCWGHNAHGMFGNGTTEGSNVPVKVPQWGTNIAAISAGMWHTCVLTTEGAVKCSGGFASAAQTIDPTPFSGLESGVTAIAYNNGYMSEIFCAIQNGALKCMGYNDFGQLGNGSTSTTILKSMQQVQGLESGVTAVALGFRHGCAIKDEKLYCWGQGNHGELGIGARASTFGSLQVQLPPGKVRSIGAAGSTTCAVIGQNVHCWGANGWGQLGDGRVLFRDKPIEVTNLGGKPSAIYARGDRTCVIVDGVAKCWGENGYGALGIGNDLPTAVLTPTAFSGAATMLALGGWHMCALISGGVQCTGRNLWNTLTTDNSASQYLAPISIVDVQQDVVAISSGEERSTCAIIMEGQARRVKCWGWNWYGALGNPSLQSGYLGYAPSYVVDASTGNPLEDVQSIASGGTFHCALQNTGAVKCWGGATFPGDIGNGQLGNDSTTSSSKAVQVVGLNGSPLQIAAAKYHACAVVADGVQCWGRNDHGQLGDRTTIDRPRATNVFGLGPGSSVTHLSLGSGRSCALVNGGLKCWGENGWGVFGDAVTGPYTTEPRDITFAKSGIEDVAVGGHTCLLRDSGAMECWGPNTFGQLGDGDTSFERLVPTQVTGL